MGPCALVHFGRFFPKFVNVLILLLFSFIVSVMKSRIQNNDKRTKHSPKCSSAPNKTHCNSFGNAFLKMFSDIFEDFEIFYLDKLTTASGSRNCTSRGAPIRVSERY